MNIANAIKSADDRPRVAVNAWGHDFYVTTFSAKTLDALQADGGTANWRARLTVATAVDASGNLLFTSADAEWLGDKSAKELDKVFLAAAELNGLMAGSTEAAVKNSESDTLADSPTA